MFDSESQVLSSQVISSDFRQKGETQKQLQSIRCRLSDQYVFRTGESLVTAE